jgi:hypothetical protein
MRIKHLLALLSASALLLLSSSAFAQQAQAPRNALSAGESALSFQVPWGGNPHVQGDTGALGGLGGLAGLAGESVLGYHYMLTDNIRGGLNLGLNVQSRSMGDEDATAFGLTLAPQINYYTSTRGTVAPYFFGQVLFSTFSDGLDQTTGDFDEAQDDPELAFSQEEQSRLRASLGYGVEWFPVTRFSISGQIGLNLNILSQYDDSGAEEGFGLNLFTSALAANIYF